MKLARIILPERDNDNGTLFLQHEQLRRDLVAMWGGYTAVKGAGAWKSGQVYTEVVWIYDIAMERADIPKLKMLAASVALNANQQCVMIVTPNGDVEFVKPMEVK